MVPPHFGAIFSTQTPIFRHDHKCAGPRQSGRSGSGSGSGSAGSGTIFVEAEAEAAMTKSMEAEAEAEAVKANSMEAEAEAEAVKNLPLPPLPLLPLSLNFCSLTPFFGDFFFKVLPTFDWLE